MCALPLSLFLPLSFFLSLYWPALVGLALIYDKSFLVTLLHSPECRLRLSATWCLWSITIYDTNSSSSSNNATATTTATAESKRLSVVVSLTLRLSQCSGSPRLTFLPHCVTSESQRICERAGLDAYQKGTKRTVKKGREGEVERRGENGSLWPIGLAMFSGRVWRLGRCIWVSVALCVLFNLVYKRLLSIYMYIALLYVQTGSRPFQTLSSVLLAIASIFPNEFNPFLSCSWGQ